MKRKIIVVCCCMGFWPPLSGQTAHSSPSAISQATAVYAPDFADAFSFGYNAAALASSPNLRAGLLSESRWLVPDIQFTWGLFSLPAAGGGAGLQIRHYGNSAYHETFLGFSYGRHLGLLCDLGVEFSYSEIGVDGFGRARAYSAALGLILHLAPRLHAGIQVENPVGGYYDGLSGEALALGLRLGLGYELNELAYLQADLSKTENYPASADFSLHLRFGDSFFGGISFQTRSLSPAGWAGWSWRKLSISITVSHSSALGFSPGLCLQLGRSQAKTPRL